MYNNFFRTFLRMAVPRIMIFAGPNGSGKSSYMKELLEHEEFEDMPYINPDDIAIRVSFKSYKDKDFEEELSKIGDRHLKGGFKGSEEETRRNDIARSFYEFDLGESIIKPVTDKEKKDKKKEYKYYIDLQKSQDGSLGYCVLRGVNLVAAQVADDLKEKYISSDRPEFAKNGFIMETVLSTDKTEKMALRAKDKGCSIHLAFVTTSDPEINVDRVKQRGKDGGHVIKEEDIIRRYMSSHENFARMLNICDNFILVDNSSESPNVFETKEESIRFINSLAKRQSPVSSNGKSGQQI